MRKLALGLTLVAVGCGDSTQNGDMAMAGGDMAAGQPDMTMTPMPDMATTPPDMVTPADMTSFAGQLTLAELATKVPLPMGDGGVGLVPVKVLSPSAGFSGGAGQPHDYDDMALIGGCSADHFDVAKNKLPLPSLDAGTVTFKGYTGGMALNGMNVPSQINCLLGAMGSYKCGYGPINGGMVGPDPSTAPFAGNAPGPMMEGDNIDFSYSGAGPFGTFDHMLAAFKTLTVMEDLTTIKYDPTMDTTIHPLCADMASCPSSVIAITMFTDQNTVAMNGQGNSATFGSLTCTGTGSAITVKKGAIAAMYGCDKNGANCDAALKSVRTAVVRIPFGAAGTTMDSKMNPVRVIPARGVVGTAPKM